MSLERIKEERKFIHDISTPLMVAIGMLDVSCSLLSKKGDIETALTRLEKTKGALEKLTLILKERRNKLIGYTEEAEGKKEGS